MKILITDPLHGDGVKLMERIGEVDLAPGLTPQQLAEKIQDYQVLVVRSKTKVTREVIDAGRQLKAIARAGVGLDNIDVEYARAKGIEVINTPGALTTAVAELVLGMMLGWARHLPRADSTMKRGLWEKNKLMGSELHGKTLGIVGTGRIGRTVGERAAAFSMDLLAYDVVVNESFAKLARYTDLDTLLHESDYVTIHVPLIPQTRHMIGSRELGLMKPTGVLINASRGGVIDEQALVEALRDHKIAGACLDVYAREPPSGPLLELPNAILTPHIGASTVEAQRSAAVLVAEKLGELFF